MPPSLSPSQYGFVFIEHSYQGQVIEQRAKDGYINATAMCRAAGRRWNDFYSNLETGQYMAALSAKTGILVKELFQSVTGPKGGTWVHPQLAVRLAMWLSADFAVQVTEWVYEWMSGASRRVTHSYVQRYSINASRIPRGHFSILNAVYQDLYGPLEHAGRVIAERGPDGTSICPDISVGRLFADWLRKKHPEHATDFVTYIHLYPDGREIPDARAYPYRMYPLYREFWESEWLPNRSVGYLRPRDPAAAAVLPAILPPAAPPYPPLPK